MELDLIVAIAILIAGLIALKTMYIHSYDSPQLQTSAQDAVRSLQARTVGTLDQSLIEGLQATLGPDALELDETIARQLLILYINGHHEEASLLAKYALNDLLPGMHYNVTVLSKSETIPEQDERYSLVADHEPVEQAATQSRIMLSGLQVAKPVYGYTATAYLTSGRAERASHARFGGFVGQGDITVRLDLPSDVTLPGDLRSFILEGDIHADFDVNVNGDYCFQVLDIDSSPGEVDVRRWDLLLPCGNFLEPGTNEVTVEFTTSDTDNHYIGGGYLKATYADDAVYGVSPTVKERHYLPGIAGVFNLYDAVYIPGELLSMDIRLHYDSDHTNTNNTVFFTLGSELLYMDNTSTAVVDHTISDSEISAALDYGDFENQTVPFRMGFDNGSLELLASNIIDAVLVTDVSGSMDWRFDINSATNSYDRGCYDPDLYDNSTKRLSVAKCASKNFTSLILNDDNQFLEPNRIGLVSYNGALRESFDLSSSESDVVAEIDGYSAGGSTCICCGILEAARMIEDDYHGTDWENVTRAMVIMTDGVANVNCPLLNNWEPYAAVSGVGDLDNNGYVNQGGDYAVAAANYSFHEYNISIYTVGIGTLDRIDNKTLYYMAAVDNKSHYKRATSPEALIDIYNDIARDIIRIADYNAQVISFEVDVEDSELFHDSYIEYEYRPYALPALNGKLLIDGERSPFSSSGACEADVGFPDAVLPVEGVITSYSGNHWTDYLGVNDEDIFDLSDYLNDYESLGDPFTIGIPPGVMSRGLNTFTLRTADDPGDPKGCSPDDKLLYTAAINNTFVLGGVYEEAEGCLWDVLMLGDLVEDIRIPSDYAGDEHCTYTGGGPGSGEDDVWRALALDVFSSFDLDNDGDLEVSFDEEELEFNAVEQEDIPYLWGPALLEVTVWR